MQTCNQNPFLTQSLKISVCLNLGYYYSHWVCILQQYVLVVIHFCQIRLKRDMNTTKQRKGEEWRRILKVWNKQNSLISVSNINYYEATNYIHIIYFSDILLSRWLCLQSSPQLCGSFHNSSQTLHWG